MLIFWNTIRSIMYYDTVCPQLQHFCRVPIRLMKMKKLLIQIFKEVNAYSTLPLHIMKLVPGMYTLRKAQLFALWVSTVLRPYQHALAHTHTHMFCSDSLHCSNLVFYWLPITLHNLSLRHEQHAAIHQRLTGWQCSPLFFLDIFTFC